MESQEKCLYHESVQYDSCFPDAAWPPETQGCVFRSILSLWMPTDSGVHGGTSAAKCFEVPQITPKSTEGAEAFQLLGVSRWALKYRRYPK